ncbi:MAG: tetratricopeptide repeat protein [Clostridiaceae bacterium]
MWGTEEQMQEFASLYPMFYGQHEERNYAKAIKVIKKLAKDGYVPAICTLGIAYYDHLGVHRNYNEAFRLYMEAALKGYPSAECGVGNFYAMAFPKHNACENDPEKAVQWWLRGSEHGNAAAQCNLSGYYLKGTGVKEDPVEAYIWASLAVHCSTIRFRIAEVFRDQAAVFLDENTRMKADCRIEELKERLPFEWSEHSIYWKKLYEEA